MNITRLTEENLNAVLAEPTVWIYKHSPTCSISITALREVEAYTKAHPEIPIYIVDVLGQRPLSNDLESRFGIRHESPQAILLRSGEPVWNDSHWRITAGVLADQGEGATADTGQNMADAD